jgi:hypothetical protein
MRWFCQEDELRRRKNKNANECGSGSGFVVSGLPLAATFSYPRMLPRACSVPRVRLAWSLMLLGGCDAGRGREELAGPRQKRLPQ